MGQSRLQIILKKSARAEKINTHDINNLSNNRIHLLLWCMPHGTLRSVKPNHKMKIYLLMVSRDHNQEQTAEFAYYSKEEAYRVRKMWNDTQEALDRKNAEEHGQSYEEWVGAWADYAFVEQVEILGEPINQ